MSVSNTNIAIVTVGIVGIALVALIARGLAPELARYMRIRRM